MPHRRLTEQDCLAWAEFVGGRGPTPSIPSRTTYCAVAPSTLQEHSRLVARLEIGAVAGGLDRATWTKFRTGKLRPERTLDLHGRTAQRAYSDLKSFLAAAVSVQLRCVEVITGRGSGEQGGVIRRELPFWLNDPALRPLILAAVHPHPANPGSVRLLLRRAR